VLESIIRDSKIKLFEVKSEIYAPSNPYYTELFKSDYDSVEKTGTINGHTVKLWTKATREQKEQQYGDQLLCAMLSSLIIIVSLCVAPLFFEVALYGMAFGFGWFLLSCATLGELLDQVRQQEALQIQEIWTEVQQQGLSGYEKRVCDVFVSKALPESSPALNLYRDPTVPVSQIEEKIRAEFSQQLETNPYAVQQGILYFRSIKNELAIKNLKYEAISSS
jgi:hypothetical protein